MPPNWTNLHGIDEAVATAIRNDPYELVGDISVTGLLRPPQMAALELAHKDEVTQDVSEGLWRLLGEAMHYVVSKAEVEGSISEHRLTTEVLGWVVSGAFDRWTNGTIVDYKCTSVWSYIFGGRAEWQAQLNLYALLAEEHRYPVTNLKIVLLLRDWNKRQARENPEWPAHPFAEIEVEKWPREYTERFLEDRVFIHQLAARGIPEYKDCTDEERWARPDSWAVTKPGAKRAYRVFDSAFKANELNDRLSGFQVVHRKGENIRCQSYCSVARFCEQAKALGVVVE